MASRSFFPDYSLHVYVRKQNPTGLLSGVDETTISH